MRIHHLALRTLDIVRLQAFYVGILGLPIREVRANGSVWLDAGGTIVMLERGAPDEPRVPAGTMDFVGFAIEPAARNAFAKKLTESGVAIEAETAFTLYFRDPDGRRVGVSHFPDEARA